MGKRLSDWVCKRLGTAFEDRDRENRGNKEKGGVVIIKKKNNARKRCKIRKLYLLEKDQL